MCSSFYHFQIKKFFNWGLSGCHIVTKKWISSPPISRLAMDARFIIRSCLGMIAVVGVVEVGDGGVVGDLPGGHFGFEGFEGLDLLLNFVDVMPKGFPHGIDFYTFFLHLKEIILQCYIITADIRKYLISLFSRSLCRLSIFQFPGLLFLVIFQIFGTILTGVGFKTFRGKIVGFAKNTN